MCAVPRDSLCALAFCEYLSRTTVVEFTSGVLVHSDRFGVNGNLLRYGVVVVVDGVSCVNRWGDGRNDFKHDGAGESWPHWADAQTAKVDVFGVCFDGVCRACPGFWPMVIAAILACGDCGIRGVLVDGVFKFCRLLFFGANAAASRRPARLNMLDDELLSVVSDKRAWQ